MIYRWAEIEGLIIEDLRRQGLSLLPGSFFIMQGYQQIMAMVAPTDQLKAKAIDRMQGMSVIASPEIGLEALHAEQATPLTAEELADGRSEDEMKRVEELANLFWDPEMKGGGSFEKS